MIKLFQKSERYSASCVCSGRVLWWLFSLVCVGVGWRLTVSFLPGQLPRFVLCFSFLFAGFFRCVVAAFSLSFSFGVAIILFFCSFWMVPLGAVSWLSCWVGGGSFRVFSSVFWRLFRCILYSFYLFIYLYLLFKKKLLQKKIFFINFFFKKLN